MITEKVINYYRFDILYFYLNNILTSFYITTTLSLRIGPLAQAGSAAGF